MYRRGTSFRGMHVMGSLLLLVLMLAALIPVAGRGTALAQGATFPLGSVVATKARTNLLDQPGQGGAFVAVLPTNSKAIVAGGPFNDGWYWLEYNDLRGYAPGSVLVQVDENWKPVAEETPTSAPTATTARPTNTPAAASGTPPPAPTAEPTQERPIDTPSTPGNYSGLWIGEMTIGGNVRSGPGLDKKVVKGWWAGRRVLLYQSVTDGSGGVWFRVSEPPELPLYVHSSLVRRVAPVQFEGAKYPGKWININITQQVVTAYVNGTPVKVTLTSTGTKKNPTEIGVWKIYYRLPKQDMDGGSLASGDYYNLKDVPFVQYFHNSGEGLHGTYWHDNFGRQMSHGCVNLTIPMSEWFYGWARIGTIVWVHY